MSVNGGLGKDQRYVALGDIIAWEAAVPKEAAVVKTTCHGANSSAEMSWKQVQRIMRKVLETRAEAATRPADGLPFVPRRQLSLNSSLTITPIQEVTATPV